jgi:hypothetical protein
MKKIKAKCFIIHITQILAERIFSRALYTHTHTRVMGTGGGGSTTSEEKISVSVRVRPLNEAEKDLGFAWRHAEDAIVLDNSRKVRFFIIPPRNFFSYFYIYHPSIAL